MFLENFRYAPVFASLLYLCAPLSAQTTSDREPGANFNATPGMSQIISAEPMGDGRLTVQARGNLYQQANTFKGAPIKNAQITTATGALAYGVNSYIEAFASAAAFNVRNNLKNGSGLGNTALGIQGKIPLSFTTPAWLGVQVASLFGTSKSQIDTNRIDGYDYLDTRKYADILTQLTQSVFLRGEKMEWRLHFNEGAISSFQAGKELAITGGTGVEFIPTPPLIIGLEANARTFLKKPSSTDPLWVTPSLVYRTPVHLNIQIGADISISKPLSNKVYYALEPWRAFGSVTFSYDLFADKRRRLANEKSQDSLERVNLTRERQDLLQKMSMAQSRADSLARENSITFAQQKAQSDSMAAAADYLAMKARQDSMSLVDTQRELQKERSKRSEAEKQLLSTGLLLLDAVYFETGKTDVSINSKPYLNIIAKMLLKYPKLQIEISGHTDNVGSQSSNLRLSQGRAESVVHYMIEAAPGLQGMLTAQGYGISQPKADNQTSEGRKLNRRTELKVLNTEVLRDYNP